MLIVCTFASKAYEGSADLLRHSVMTVGQADRCYVYREADVEPWFQDHPDLRPPPALSEDANKDPAAFKPGHSKATTRRGYGYWSWKPWVVRSTLRNHARQGDVVLYLDAGMVARGSLRPLVAPLLADPDPPAVLLVGMSGGHTNAQYTHASVFRRMGCDTPEHREAVQINAAVQAYRRCSRAMEFLGRYESWCGQADIVGDGPPEDGLPGFVDHRHDQSILSLLAVSAQTQPWITVVQDPTQYGAGRTDRAAAAAGRHALDHHRRALPRLQPRVAVITPTVGGPHLEECVRSVQRQELPGVVHYVVVDGPRYEAEVDVVLRRFEGGCVPIVKMVLPHNVGAGGWNGHRVYGSLPYLVDADYVCFLDADNAFDPDHVRLLAQALAGSGARWAYSLRRIVDARGADVCPDNCESLGGIYHACTGVNDRLVDTSCYMLHRDVAIDKAWCWNVRARQPGAVEVDRRLCMELLASEPHVCVRKHTVRYRLEGNPRSVQAGFFLEGNRRFAYDFAAKPDLYVYHFSPEVTRAMLALRRGTAGGEAVGGKANLPHRSLALIEWQMTLLRGMEERYNLLDGYAVDPNVPPGACVYVSMCMPDQVPWKTLERNDLWKVVYTGEGPNIRHATQWDPVTLRKHFDVVLTYWEPLLRQWPDTFKFCPHNVHHLDLDDPADRAQLRDNTAGCGHAGDDGGGDGHAGVSCVMVLERRNLQGSYRVPNVPDVQLTCLDPLRELLVADLKNVTVYGSGWAEAAARHPNLKLGHTLRRSQDPRHAVDILQNYTCVVIVENCDGEGYVSEKVYDALMAGCLPLYYGNVSPRLVRELGLGDDDDKDADADAVVPGAPFVLAGCVLDLRALLADVPLPGWSRRLQAFLDDDLTPERVARWKRRVVERRERVLRAVGVADFARRLCAALDARPDHAHVPTELQSLG
jgi:hypothetical protein